ncbi:MAG: biopolymer transporter ExbD [Alteromonadaceae bacterium]|uniref:ExbD/TolR family protein n=1 Tax=unclassified Marinobacter TaxID=83889 RepID=UPI000C5FC791|nr:biopolymer transporter ExbD [Marinobacter sp. BGYM27]MAA63500.1 biopolymer transporter ExbD [Alteromonadaceae bacterium]MBH87373.1 biopolymer transporter ExbD [Alteromonadaceae bacterium]MDG5499048.1 biopolymer transporter ExbD [Marinobacter sp. BGYM27]
MKTSRRAQRMQRHYGRMHRAGGLNLVSLMDIFTILVFFLMVNSSDVKVMQQSSDVALPKSSSEKPGQETLTIEVTTKAVMVQGRQVASLSDGVDENGHLKGLLTELNYRKARQADIPQSGLEITVMADRSTEYRQLRQIMQTCVDADYRRIKLAVEHQPGAAVEAANG